MTQGKCTTCGVRWTWAGPITARRGVRCPCCGDELHKTTHHLRWPVRLTTRYAVRGRSAYNPHCFGDKGCRKPVTAVELAELRRLEPEIAAAQTPAKLLELTRPEIQLTAEEAGI